MRGDDVTAEPDEALAADPGRARSVDLIVACGDLPFDYLGSLMNALDAPLVFVPGNHDPDLSGYRVSRAGLTLRAGMPVRAPWPDGAVRLQSGTRVVNVTGSHRMWICPRAGDPDAR
jgi:predicted phosphodiesterase